MPKRESKPTKFIPLNEAFKPQVGVQATRDLNGWADKKNKIKWHISKGSFGYMDADKAREFEIKGYVRVTSGRELIKPVSDDERAEIMSTMTTIGIGKNNG